MPTYKILVVSSAALFVIGSAFLASSIKWRAESLSKGLEEEQSERIRNMASPGWTDQKYLKTGIVLNALGYALLIISTIVSP